MSFIVGPPYDFDQLQHAYESRVPGVSQQIAPGEQMPHTHRQHYFGVGEDVIRLVKLAMLASRKRASTIQNILDLPCGHGRVTRSLRAAFPEARVTACDLLTDGVDYCAKTFNATGVYSQIHPTTEMFANNGPYDLIFVGSLFTHLDTNRWPEFLTLFDDILAPDGILIFTVHGPFVAYRFQNGESYGYLDQHVPSHISHDLETATSSSADRFANKAAAYIINQYRKNDFGYLDDGTGYGISVSRPSWTMKQIENYPDLQLLSYLERGWDNHQDVCTVIKRRFVTTDAGVGHPFV
jgi:SAM-dependent methyltransferase